ncbi:MAG: copper resistance protein CopC [Gemmatimonadaceae bacterium]
MVRKLAGLVAACLLSAPSLAFAHGGLKSSVPAKGATLNTAPTEIRLVFTEAAELAFTRVELRGPGGVIRLGTPSFGGSDKRAVVAPLDASLVAGLYTVTWQVAGADGHPVRGTYTFSIAADASGLVTPPVAAPAAGPGGPEVHHDPETFPDAGGFNAESPLYVLIRWLQFAAILILTGAIAFHLFVLGFLRKKQRPDSPMLRPASQQAANIGFYAALALALVVVVRLLAQSYAMHAPGAGFAPALMWAMIGQTTWGWGWLLQALATFGAIAGFSAARRGSRQGWRIATVSAVLGAFAPALSGHAASAPTLRPLAILADGLHIVGASGWLGSLLILLVAGIPAAMRLEKDARGPAVADLVNAFSPTALAFAGLTATAGVFAGWLHLGAIPALWQTQYGRTLLVKLAILGIVTATGAYNFLYVKPRLGSSDGIKNIRRSATIEVGVAVLVLLVTAVLVATPTPMDMTRQ